MKRKKARRRAKKEWARAKKARRATRKLKAGQVVAVLWLDSGRDSETRTAPLAKRWVYGRVDSIVGNRLHIAMDVCVGMEDDDAGNYWGTVWIPSVLKCHRMKRA